MKKFTKRIISVMLAMLLALSVLVTAPYAASADLVVAVDQASCLQGETVTATIYFPSAYNKAAAFDVQLKYDTTRFELVTLERGAGLNNALDAQINGKVFSENSKIPGEIKWVLAGSNNFDFSGVFAVATFNVKNTAAGGSTELDIEVTNASNSGYVDITASVITQDATIEIIRNSENDFVFEINEERTGYIITGYSCVTVAELTIPAEYNELPVIGIGDEVFYNHGELIKVNLPEHLEFIGNGAFKGCANLTAIDIPNTVTSLGEEAFMNCSELEDVKLSFGLETIEANTFYACYFIQKIEIPFTVKSIGENAFFNCLSLGSVKLSKNTTIGNGAFEKCLNSGVKFTTVEGNTYLAELIEDTYPNAKIEFVKDISLGEIKGTIEEIDYTGAPINLELEIKLDNGETVVENTDYEVVYVNNYHPGKAKVYVPGIDGYGEGYVFDFDIECAHDSVKRTYIQKLSCTQDGIIRCECNRCEAIFDEIIPAKGHPSGEWVYDKLPSYNETGIMHKDCTVCNEAYELNTVAEKIYPDVNFDGFVNSTDALLVLQYAVGKDIYIEPAGLLNADANGDSKINSSDALIMLQIAVGKIVLD